MPTSKQLEQMQISFYSKKNTMISSLMNIGEVFCFIRGGQYKKDVDQIRTLRNQGRIEQAQQVKFMLPGVTFSATFGADRKGINYINYNSILVLDIDKLIGDEVERVQHVLAQDPYIAAYWLSPSGNGWKGLIHLTYQEEEGGDLDTKDKHGLAFRQIDEYMKTNYQIELDKSGKDISRLCFMSYDPLLVVKPEFASFVVVITTADIGSIKSGSTNSGNRSISETPKVLNWNSVDGKPFIFIDESRNRKIMDRIYKYLSKRHLSITETWENWTKVAFSIANTFHPYYGRRMFMKLCELDGAKHDAVKSENLIYDAYFRNEGKCSFTSIIYLAKIKGWQA